MPAKLIICCDGTWNWPDQKGGPTNVIKMVRALEPSDDQGVPQVVYYHPGVGTGNWVDRVFGGGFGIGLSRNVQDAYQFLVNNYQDGDEIFLFGFSRGAYTVRSLAGLIGCVGLLRKGDMDQFPQAYELYRTPPKDRPLRREVLLKDVTNPREPSIAFIGVWDTVGALGIPMGWFRWVGRRLYNFHDTDLGRNVRRAYQALAIDEKRAPFRPAVWRKVHADVQQEVEQVWFAGVHSNVGGGYPDRGLSDLAFLWMVGKAVAAGLAIDTDYIRRKVVNTMGRLEESRTGSWRLWPAYERPLCTTDPSERVHPSVTERRGWKAAGTFEPYPYDPPNVRTLERSKPLDGVLAVVAPLQELLSQPDVRSTPEKQRDAEIDAPKV